MSLVERVKEIASTKGYTLAKIERELSFANGSIRKWDKGIPSADKLYQVATLLSTTMEYLLTGQEREEVYDSETIELMNELMKLDKRNRRKVEGYIYELSDTQRVRVNTQNQADAYGKEAT